MEKPAGEGLRGAPGAEVGRILAARRPFEAWKGGDSGASTCRNPVSQ